jgi:hypothetical protein
MIGLFTLLFFLGISAVDPIGIAAMPILLLQDRPYRRSFIFLSGSFFSLTLMGVLFARGFGIIVLHFNTSHPWLISYAEAISGIILLCVGTALLWRLKKGSLSTNPPHSFISKLQLGNTRLFIVGALIVAIQSVIDVVFVIAMIRAGQLQLPNITLLLAVITYAIAALLLQLLVVLTYWITPIDRKTKTLNKVHRLLSKYANQVLISVSFLIGIALLVLAARN